MTLKPKLGKDALILSATTLITVLVWIGFEIHQTATKSTISKLTQQQMAPLSPKINKKILQTLKDNFSFSQEELNTLPPVEEEENEPVEGATQSSQITP